MSPIKTDITIFWFRRDLRLHDNHALCKALSSGYPVLPIFIFDTTILSELNNKSDARVQFIYHTLLNIHRYLQQKGSGLHVFFGTPEEVWKTITEQYSVKAVFCNNDYEPYARKRDAWVENLLTEKGIPFTSVKDQVIFEKEDIVKDDGKPYTVFTPYSKKWKATFASHTLPEYPSFDLLDNLVHCTSEFPTLQSIGFTESEQTLPPLTIDKKQIQRYANNRDNPALDDTTRLGIHLRFGTISVRHLVQLCETISETFVNELIWREFFMQILWFFPDVQFRSFRKEYDNISWLNNEEDFTAWKEGKTGYPMVDAGMRQLKATGFMHNRVRMVTASFLCKHLLIDWRWGERYFAEKLLDYELSANNGNWQWAAGTGCDAAPYFRVFNPTAQQEKFDPDFVYCKRWIPELGTHDYPLPIIEHSYARERVLSTYKKALEKE